MNKKKVYISGAISGKDYTAVLLRFAKAKAATTTYAPLNAYAYLGSRLCFKSSARAEQFGKQFADLYNKVFLKTPQILEENSYEE